MVVRCAELSAPGSCGICCSPQMGVAMPRLHSSVELPGFVSFGTMSALPLIVYLLRFVYVVAGSASTMVGALVPPWQFAVAQVPAPAAWKRGNTPVFQLT